MFGLGNPIQSDNQDGTFTYLLTDSSEINEFNHINVRDTSISDAAIDSNYGVESYLTNRRRLSKYHQFNL